jgi:hypothetical protein
VSLLAVFHWSSLLHPLTGDGYQFWSGIGSDVGEVTILGALVMIYRKHECHVERCHRPAWHPHPEHDHPVCKRHHPDAGMIR